MSRGDRQVLFELAGATLGYGRRVVLRGVDLQIREGDFWCVIGPNASGKTTLIRTLLGQLAPLGGRRSADPDRAAPAHVGFVPQQSSLNPTLPTTVREFVSLGFVGLSVGKGERRERMIWALAKVDLGGREKESLARLSGGQRQRALLARALVRRPAILVLDEPTQELDAVAERQFLAALGDLNAREGVTVVFVTHELDIPARHASHVAYARKGTLATGPKEEMLTPSALAETFGADRSFFEGLTKSEAVR
jgi:ABC-type Mn2+/Zn2+ transport system ATPase subunit